MQNEKQRVALVSMLASGLLAIGKFTIGLFTGSIGLISEGIHSSSDFIATVITWWAVHISDKPADDNHHYGHGKMESMAALFEVALLFGAAGWIAYEAVQRLMGEPHEIIAAPVVIAILLVSIVVDFFRVRALRRVAKSTNSPALEADALHFFSDMLASGVVLIGIVFVTFGFLKADAIAAIIVACFIFSAAATLGKRSFDSLVDTAPAGTEAKIASLMKGFPEVIEIERTRVRNAGPMLFIELTLAVSRGLPLELVSELKDHITLKLQQNLNNAEITLIARPRSESSETIATRVRIIAANLDRAIHRLTILQLPDRLSISFDLELEADLSLEQSNTLVRILEEAIRTELGPQIEIDTHIEPIVANWLEGRDASAERQREFENALYLASGDSGQGDKIHNVRVRETKQGLIIYFNYCLPSHMAVNDIHTSVDRVERVIRSSFPDVFRVIGHAEPLK
ncbi:cation diffusion facilitator family transporter [Budvicia diplopodorum]|uniref:cation diffusion facilitator family transporter n=1 Tax=Budvicia diplopodorum TaxID=1119056 RepID=UPI00135CD5BA|nr:cation diffusion facilitator family transporter [Budvicia diplopodorum]